MMSERERERERERENNESDSNDSDKSTSKTSEKENRKRLNDKNSRKKGAYTSDSFIIDNGNKDISYADRKSNKHSFAKRSTRHCFTR